jgi:rubrerythrin
VRSTGVLRGTFPDWTCPKCSFIIFGKKDHCYKCNVDKSGQIIKEKRDWKCPKCNFLIFGSKEKCFKCNVNRIY